VTVQPLWDRPPLAEPVGVHGETAFPEVKPAPAPRRIAVAIDFSSADPAVLSHALSQARASGRGAKLLLMHVVESGAARVLGQEQQDKEARSDQQRGDLYCDELINLGVDAQCMLGFGDPVEELARLIEQHSPDLLIMGGHGHGLVGDWVHGTTVDRLRHRTRVPILVIPAAAASASPADPQ
jgi:manganese transport protein